MMDPTTPDDPLTALLARAGMERFRDLLTIAVARLGGRLDDLPGWVAHVVQETDGALTPARALLAVIDVSLMLTSAHASLFLARAGLLASERLRAAAAPLDTSGQSGS